MDTQPVDEIKGRFDNDVESLTIEIRDRKALLSGKTTRSQLIEQFGEPDDIGGFSRKKKIGSILKYGEIEFHFTGDKPNDCLRLIFQDGEVNGEYIPYFSVNFKE